MQHHARVFSYMTLKLKLKVEGAGLAPARRNLRNTTSHDADSSELRTSLPQTFLSIPHVRQFTTCISRRDVSMIAFTFAEAERTA